MLASDLSGPSEFAVAIMSLVGERRSIKFCVQNIVAYSVVIKFIIDIVNNNDQL